MILSEQKSKQELMIKLFNKARIKHVYGMVFSYNEEGQARFDLPYNPQFDHGLDGIHGGVFATLLDNAGGKLIRTGSRIASCEMEVRTFKNRLVATGSGIFTITNQKIEI